MPLAEPDDPVRVDAPSPVLAVEVIGTVRATVEGRAVPLPSRLIRAVLACIALSDNHEVTRERLWTLFWPESAPPNAQASLRQIVKKLREAMHEVGYTGHSFDKVWLRLDADSVRVDLKEAIDDALRHRVHPLLRTGGNLMDGVLSDAYGLNEDVTNWVLHLRNDVVKILAGALETGLGNTELPLAQQQDIAEALLSLNPCHEAACRALMLARAASGDPAGAERAFLDLEKALADDLDSEPSEETLRIYSQVKLDSEAGATPLAPVRPAPEVAEVKGPSVAILPFLAPDDPTLPPYFGKGLAEELIAALATYDEMSVISHGTTVQFATEQVDTRLVGRMLGVQYVLSGTLRRQGERVRLLVSLADATTGKVLWPYQFIFANAELFDVLDRMVAQVIGIVAPRIRTVEMQRARRMRPESMTAHDHVLRGMDLMSQLRREGFEQAREHFRQALAIEPDYAMALALAGEWHSLWLGQGWSADRAHDQAESLGLSQAAVDRDPTNVRALTVLAHDRAFLFRDYDGALALFHRAEAFSPGSAQVWAMSAPTYRYIGETAEAVRRIELAKKLSPQDLFAYRHNITLAIAHYAAHAFDKAMHWGRVALAQNGRYSAIPRFLAASAVAMGDLPAARGYADMLMAIEPDFRVSGYRPRCPFCDASRVDLMCQRLLAAGLPA